MIRKVMTLALSLVFMLPLTGVALATSSTISLEDPTTMLVSPDEKNQIINTVTEYLDFIDQCFVDGAFDNKKFAAFFSSNYDESNELYNLENAVIEVQIENRKLQEKYGNDIRYSKIVSDYELEDIEVIGNVAEVTILKSETRWYFDGREPEEGFSNPHIFGLVKENSNWYIIKHDYANEFKTLLTCMTESKKVDLENAKERYLVEAEEIISSEIEEMKNIIKQYGSLEAYNEIRDKAILNDLQNQSINPSPQAFSYHGYRTADAVAFATKYASQTTYPSPHYYYSGADCTNFTSTCLKYGGITYDDIGTYQWYFYSTSNKTAEYTAARYFRAYAVNNVGSTTIKGLFSTNGILATVSEGDIIQLYNSSDGLAYHSMIALYSSNGDVRIAQHTDNGFFWLSSKPATRYYRDIYGSYY